MKSHRNPILNGVTSRIRQLLERYEESKTIAHQATKGSLREAYLKQFLADFIPHPFAIKSGFVTDCRGDNISPQIDLLVFDITSIPSFTLSEFIVVVPLEAMRLCIEVKSLLKLSDYSQIQRQQEAIRKMRFAWATAGRELFHSKSCSGMTQIIFAFDTECSEETLLSWFAAESSLDAICVVGKYCLLRDPNTNKVESLRSNSEHIEILHLVSRVHAAVLSTHRAIRELAKHKDAATLNFEPDIGAYLTFDVPYPDSN